MQFTNNGDSQHEQDTMQLYYQMQIISASVKYSILHQFFCSYRKLHFWSSTKFISQQRNHKILQHLQINLSAYIFCGAVAIYNLRKCSQKQKSQETKLHAAADDTAQAKLQALA